MKKLFEKIFLKNQREKIVLVDCSIRINFGFQTMNDMYLGVYLKKCQALMSGFCHIQTKKNKPLFTRLIAIDSLNLLLA